MLLCPKSIGKANSMPLKYKAAVKTADLQAVTVSSSGQPELSWMITVDPGPWNDYTTAGCTAFSQAHCLQMPQVQMYNMTIY